MKPRYVRLGRRAVQAVIGGPLLHLQRCGEYFMNIQHHKQRLLDLEKTLSARTIEERRLEAVPWTPYCLKREQRLEVAASTRTPASNRGHPSVSHRVQSRQNQIMTHAVVWIDHKEARILHVHPEATDDTTVLAPQHHLHRSPILFGFIVTDDLDR
jgi:hypothetical protein